MRSLQSSALSRLRMRVQFASGKGVRVSIVAWSVVSTEDRLSAIPCVLSIDEAILLNGKPQATVERGRIRLRLAP